MMELTWQLATDNWKPRGSFGEVVPAGVRVFFERGQDARTAFTYSVSAMTDRHG